MYTVVRQKNLRSIKLIRQSLNSTQSFQSCNSISCYKKTQIGFPDKKEASFLTFPQKLVILSLMSWSRFLSEYVIKQWLVENAILGFNSRRYVARDKKPSRQACVKHSSASHSNYFCSKLVAWHHMEES
jgi:hypothetical protein